MSKSLVWSAFGCSSLTIAALCALRLISANRPPPLERVGAIDLPHASPRVIELAEVMISSDLPRPASPLASPLRRQTKLPDPAADLVPCSEWREIGPVLSVREGEVPRQRHVQLLCPGTALSGAWRRD